MSNLPLFTLKNKKALVTGSSSGIGEAFALALAQGGADVAVIARNQEKAEIVVDKIRSLGRHAIFVQCDVCDEKQVELMLEEVTKCFGRLDIAINNAGLNAIHTETEYQPQSKNEWQQLIDTNLTGTWLCAEAEARWMMKQVPVGGKIINTASTAAHTVGSNDAYLAAKAAVVHLTRSLAVKFSSYNITVNCISPDLVISPMIESFIKEEATHKYLRGKIPLGYMQRPEDLCGPIQFLSSAASDYITGQELVVDGGITICSEPPARVVPERVSIQQERAAISEMLKNL